MLPVNCGSHTDYQHFVVTNLRKYYPDPDALARSTWDIIERFWNLDLSFTDTFMADKYSKFGPAPRTPSCMQRSYLLSIDFKVTSLTDWAAQIKINPLYAILSGFEPGNTPGVGTFYDFINRLWNSDDDHMSPHIHPLKTKVKKPKTKGTKADSVEKVTVAELLPALENTDFKLDEQPYSSLFTIYHKVFLDISVSQGLIHTDALALAGDGTPVVTSHRERKKRICKCKENGITDCKCDRFFSQPDCDIGWDSSRDCYYHGYDLYMLVDSQSDLPVFPHFSCASKHDSHGFLHAFPPSFIHIPDVCISSRGAIFIICLVIFFSFAPAVLQQAQTIINNNKIAFIFTVLIHTLLHSLELYMFLHPFRPLECITYIGSSHYIPQVSLLSLLKNIFSYISPFIFVYYFSFSGIAILLILSVTFFILDCNYIGEITLDSLADLFYINNVYPIKGISPKGFLYKG